MADFTIVIPHFGNPLGLWATIHSCDEEIRSNNPEEYTYNYVIVTNGQAKLKPEEHSTIVFLKDSGRLCKHLHFNEALNPPAARQRGVEFADGEILFFFDNHCLVARDYFRRAMAYMRQRPEMDMLHSTTKYYSADPHCYEYRLKLDYNFWGDAKRFPMWDYRAYKIAAGGHGGFCIRRSAWDAVGGYGPEHLFDGYGGEELIFDLKMWRLGRNNWIDPKMIHFHYAGNRGYVRHFSDKYYINMLVSAHVIGGEKWLYKTFESFTTKSHLRLHPKLSWWEILELAYERSKDYAAEVDRKSIMTLDELLPWFVKNDVSC